MPQVLRVVRCYKCESFQVDIEKASNKWKCKLCGERQSLKTVYSSGTGIDCRKLVQELNQLRFKKDTLLNLKLEQLTSGSATNSIPTETIHTNDTPSTSKWDQFIDNSIDSKTTEEVNQEFRTSPPNKKAKFAINNDESELEIFHFVECTSAKRPKKRHLLNESEHTTSSPAKYSKLCSTAKSSFISEPKINMSANKWLQYEDCNTAESNIYQKENSTYKCKRKTSERKNTGYLCKSETTIRDESNSNTSCNVQAGNCNWNFYTEWDSFSEPSQTSCNESELIDIVDDQFEEFENKPSENTTVQNVQNKPFGIFSSLDNNEDLDSILNL